MNSKKEYYTKQVILKEQNLAEQAKLLQLAGEKEREARELKKGFKKLISQMIY